MRKPRNLRTSGETSCGTFLKALKLGGPCWVIRLPLLEKMSTQQSRPWRRLWIHQIFSLWLLNAAGALSDTVRVGRCEG